MIYLVGCNCLVSVFLNEWQPAVPRFVRQFSKALRDQERLIHGPPLSRRDFIAIALAPYIGGAFGSALRTWPHVTLAAGRATGWPAGAPGTKPAIALLLHRLPPACRIACPT